MYLLDRNISPISCLIYFLLFQLVKLMMKYHMVLCTQFMFGRCVIYIRVEQVKVQCSTVFPCTSISATLAT